MTQALAGQAVMAEEKRPLRVRAHTAAELLDSIADAIARADAAAASLEPHPYSDMKAAFQRLADAAVSGGQVQLNNREMKALLNADRADASFYLRMWQDGMVSCNTEGGANFTLSIPSNINELAAQADQSPQMTK